VDGDTTCRVCLYSGTTPSTTNLIRCNAPGTALTAADLYGSHEPEAGSTAFPAMLRLDDGSSCAFY
jgi:hypothetical protein